MKSTDNPEGTFAEPSPEWESAPYEESGVVGLDMLLHTVRAFAARWKSMTMTIERTDDTDLFKYHLKEDL